MRASEAWRKYGRDNGVENLSQLISRTDKYKAKHTKKNLISDPVIGCILLKDPEFYDNDNLKTDKSEGIDFPKQVVKIKYFDINAKERKIPKPKDLTITEEFISQKSKKKKK